MLMKTTIAIVLTCFFSLALKAQMAEPVKWSFKSEKIGNNDYKVSITATIEDGWYVYSQDLPNNGPIPTKIKFEHNPQVIFEGKPIELGNKKQDFDQNFNMTVTKLSGQPTYMQKVVNVGNVPSVKGTLTFMTCNGEMCMPPKQVEFNVNLQ
jgi:thiol:disulfide interchange protein